MKDLKDNLERVLSKLIDVKNTKLTPNTSFSHLDKSLKGNETEIVMLKKSSDTPLSIRNILHKSNKSYEESKDELVKSDTTYNDRDHAEIPSIHKISSFDFNIYLKMFIHELRTPISTISMGLDLIKSEFSASKNKENLHTINNMKKSIQFMEDIFTKFSVIQEGNIELNPFEPFSLKALLSNVNHLLTYHIKEGDMFFQCNIHPDVYDWVYGDMHNLKHCIINLLKNAIKYQCEYRSSVVTIDIYKTAVPSADPITTNTVGENQTHPRFCEAADKLVVDGLRPSDQTSPGTKHPLKLVVGGYASQKPPDQTIVPHPPTDSNTNKSLKSSRKMITKNKQHITISIKDNNEPILPHIKSRLFQSFNSTSGSGLGLYICKNIIDLHGGNIQHTFIEPHGNQFCIHLHMELCEDTTLQISEPEHHSDEKKDNSSTNSEEGTSRKSSINIIIIDDSILNRKLMYKLLKKVNNNYNIYTSINGRDTMKRKEFIVNRMKIIFLDKYMPLMSGIEVAKQLRESGYNQLIIGLTGEDNESSNELFLSSGADIVFIKPLDICKLHMINDFIMTHGTDRQEKKTIQIIHNKLEWSED